jgi:hypothetical protein
MTNDDSELPARPQGGRGLSAFWLSGGGDYRLSHCSVRRFARWGKKPETLPAALDIVRQDFETWPRLLSIYGHRFLAAQPGRSGNPIFSIMQTDIICYGADLPHYLLNEFVDHDYALHTHAQTIRRIEIWNDFAEG